MTASPTAGCSPVGMAASVLESWIGLGPESTWACTISVVGHVCVDPGQGIEAGKRDKILVCLTAPS